MYNTQSNIEIISKAKEPNLENPEDWVHEIWLHQYWPMTGENLNIFSTFWKFLNQPRIEWKTLKSDADAHLLICCTDEKLLIAWRGTEISGCQKFRFCSRNCRNFTVK